MVVNVGGDPSLWSKNALRDMNLFRLVSLTAGLQQSKGNVKDVM
jgi:hypothetical protein